MRKLFDLMTDEKNPIWMWLPDNSAMYKFAKYLKDNNVRVVTQCKDCMYSREKNEYEKDYLVDDVLICACPECTDDCWNPVCSNHFCKCGIVEEEYKMLSIK